MEGTRPRDHKLKIPNLWVALFWLAGGDDFVVGFAAGEAAFFGGEFQGFFAVEFGLVD